MAHTAELLARNFATAIFSVMGARSTSIEVSQRGYKGEILYEDHFSLIPISAEAVARSDLI
jgi:hypothetical protein